VGLAVLLGLLALRRGGPLAVARLVALLAAAALLTVAAPLARSALLTGQVPGLALATASLTRGAGADPAIMGDLVRFGIGRSPADLARLPFALTFHTDAFEWPPTPWGPFGRLIGYLFFGLGPLLLVARPRPRALALCAGIAVATLLWFYTAQYLRYGLPILAMFLPVAGLAYVSVQQGIKGAAPRAALGVLVVVLAAAGGALQLRVPTYERDYVLGRQDRATYLSRYSFCCAGYTALHLVDQQPDVGGVFVVPDPGLLYTRARLSSPQTFVGDGPTSATDAATALARLDAGHVTYIVLGRWYFGRPPYFDAPSWDAAPLLTEEFLRRNTVLVGGGDGDNTYVYSLLPPDQRGKEQSWAQGHELLPNGELAAGPVGVPAGWVATGQPRYDAATHAVLATTNDYLSTTVPVTPNVQYLLSHVTRSAGGEAWARLRVTWRDRAGRVVGDTIEAAPASPRGDHTFSMLATAPAGAATATVYAQADSGEVWFADFSFRTVQPDGAAASGARRE
ncbi:MAG TPA: hypothetical protein VFL91_18140, partial [Thermomicrobiales bacterium]|nr:hypothetical protein [Thermomicrobiales bacterium]